jgi:hypothetical protein
MNPAPTPEQLVAKLRSLTAGHAIETAARRAVEPRPEAVSMPVPTGERTASRRVRGAIVAIAALLRRRILAWLSARHDE